MVPGHIEVTLGGKDERMSGQFPHFFSDGESLKDSGNFLLPDSRKPGIEEFSVTKPSLELGCDSQGTWGLFLWW
jgi:hypothetical protein